jgi:hypothetical protein
MNVDRHWQIRSLLLAAACIEVATGLTLVVAPALFVQLLLGEAITAAGVAVGRVTGCALVALGVACWPRLTRDCNCSTRPLQPLLGMLTYNGLISIYLVGLGLTSQSVGLLLWPGAALHIVFTALIIRAIFRP